MIFSNNSALTRLLQTEECSIKLLMGEGICKAAHKFNTGSFAEGEIALDFIYHGYIEYVINYWGPQRMFVYSCQAGNFEPFIIVSGYRMDLEDAIDFITVRYYDIYRMHIMRDMIYMKGMAGFEALCRLLKSYWYFNSNIKNNQYGRLIQTLKRYDTVRLYQFPNDYSNPVPYRCISLHLSGTYIIDLTPEYLEKWTK